MANKRHMPEPVPISWTSQEIKGWLKDRGHTGKHMPTKATLIRQNFTKFHRVSEIDIETWIWE